MANGSDNTIGGKTADTRNVISRNSQVGATIQGFFATGNKVQGNFIGTNAAGTTALRTGGVTVDGGFLTGNLVQGNFIGTNAAGTAAIPNAGPGVDLLRSFPGDPAIGGTATTIGDITDTDDAGNLIAGNAGPGIRIVFGSPNPIKGNSIYSNGGLGIDLGGDGVTPNDPGDTDTSANELQNFRPRRCREGVGGRGPGQERNISTANGEVTLDLNPQ